MTDDLVAFLRARLDEQAARAWAIHDVGQCDALLYEQDMAGAARRDPDCECGHPSRTRREIDAKRRIIAEHPVYAHGVDLCCETCGSDTTDGSLVGDWPCTTLCLLALPYADHPSFRDQWRV